MKNILDAGPLIAALNSRDEHHRWACETLERLGPPFSCVKIKVGLPFPREQVRKSVLAKARRFGLVLYLLLRRHGFTIRDYQRAFVDAGLATQCDLGLTRLCSGVPQRDDEGYAHLLSKAPSLEEMQAFFVEQRNQLEIETAAAAAPRQPKICD